MLQSGLSVRMTRVVFFTVVPLPQNGHVALSKETEERSMEPVAPDHVFGSLAGSSPLNENLHVSCLRSTSTYRFLPGQFESYTITRAVLTSGYSMANGVTACPPSGLYRPRTLSTFPDANDFAISATLFLTDNFKDAVASCCTSGRNCVANARVTARTVSLSGSSCAVGGLAAALNRCAAMIARPWQ